MPQRIPEKYLTPPTYADRIGVKPETVIGWIRSGELRAFNVASRKATRPRFRIPIDAIIAFENGRTEQPAAKPKRRRKTNREDVINFF